VGSNFCFSVWAYLLRFNASILYCCLKWDTSSVLKNNNNNKYSQLSSTHVFVPVAIETGCTWHHQAVELVQEIGRRTANITGDARESTFLF